MPEEWIAFLEEWQNKLPEGSRQRAAQLLDRLPGMPKTLCTLLDKVYERARRVQHRPRGDRRRRAGESGKSTLINKLTGWEVARVSPAPGTTRETHWVQIGPFRVADTPGINEAGGEELTAWPMEAAGRADPILLLFDAGTGITQSNLQIYKQVKALGKPILVAMNKIDLAGSREFESCGLRRRFWSCAARHLVQDRIPPGRADESIDAARLARDQHNE